MQPVADLQHSSDIPGASDAMRSNESSNPLVLLNCFLNLLADVVSVGTFVQDQLDVCCCIPKVIFVYLGNESGIVYTPQQGLFAVELVDAHGDELVSFTTFDALRLSMLLAYAKRHSSLFSAHHGQHAEVSSRRTVMAGIVCTQCTLSDCAMTAL